MPIPNRVVVEFTGEEALVLWSFLARCSDQGTGNCFDDPVEERMAWELELRLQRQLTKVILDNPDYARDLEDARKAVRAAFPE